MRWIFFSPQVLSSVFWLNFKLTGVLHDVQCSINRFSVFVHIFAKINIVAANVVLWYVWYCCCGDIYLINGKLNVIVLLTFDDNWLDKLNTCSRASTSSRFKRRISLVWRSSAWLEPYNDDPPDINDAALPCTVNNQRILVKTTHTNIWNETHQMKNSTNEN